MKKGQAHVAAILIVVLILIVVSVLLLVFFTQAGSNGSSGYTPPTNYDNNYATGNNPTWCMPGESGYYEGAYAVFEGMTDFQGENLCKASLTYGGESIYLYSNEDSSVWYMTDTGGNILESYLDYQNTGTDTGAGNSPPTASENTEVCLSHGELMDFVNGVKYTDEDVWPNCDLEETPFSAGQGMAAGAGLRTCSDKKIAAIGSKDLSMVTASDITSANFEDNPSAVIGGTFLIEMRNGNYVALKITDISSDQNTVCFEWTNMK